MELLGRAAADLEEALELVVRAGKGSEFEILLEKVADNIREALGPGDGHSVNDVMGSIAHTASEHPIWTRPLDSVKYAERKDI